jgi:hypothetical protein
MHKHLIPALALLAAFAMPALAAESDMLADALATRWQAVQEVMQATLIERRVMQAKLAEQQAQIAATREKCGAPCQHQAPQAKTDPAHPVPPGQ